MIKYSTKDCLYAMLEKPFEEGWDEYGQAPLSELHQRVLEIINPFDTFLEVGPGL